LLMNQPVDISGTLEAWEAWKALPEGSTHRSATCAEENVFYSFWVYVICFLCKRKWMKNWL
jgi:uncharacterized membrane protein